MARIGHPVFDVIADKLDPDPGTTVVDLGCGRGPAMHALHDREPTVALVGFDHSSESIAAVHAELPQAWAQVADLNGRLPLSDQSVEGVVSHNVLECLEDPIAVLDEAARVLRAGGKAIWSHADFDAIVLSGPDRELTRQVLHAYADHVPAGTPRSDGQLGRQLAALVRRSRMQLANVDVHLTTSAELEGDARARVDEIAHALRDCVSSVSAGDVVEWRHQVDLAQHRREFFFCEPCFVVTAQAG